MIDKIPVIPLKNNNIKILFSKLYNFMPITKTLSLPTKKKYEIFKTRPLQNLLY